MLIYSGDHIKLACLQKEENSERLENMLCEEWFKEIVKLMWLDWRRVAILW